MRLFQSLANLEQGAIVHWIVPGRWIPLKPKFGSEHHDRKFIWKILYLLAFLGFYFYPDDWSRVEWTTWLVAVGLFLVLAWTLAHLLHRIFSRHVWLFADRMLIAGHEYHHEMARTQTDRVHFYRIGQTKSTAIEFLSIAGVATVVALPNTVEPATLIAALRDAGYLVQSDL